MNNWTRVIGWLMVIVVVIVAAVWFKKVADRSSPGVVSSVVATSTPHLATVKVFFGNRRYDPQSLYCETVYPTTRQVSKTAAVGEAALNELLAGPTEVEQAEGFVTSLNEGVILKSLKIQNGVALADFSPRLDEGVGGSCRVTAIRAQITETLKQFPTVSTVVISVDGESQEVLQP